MLYPAKEKAKKCGGGGSLHISVRKWDIAAASGESVVLWDLMC